MLMKLTQDSKSERDSTDYVSDELVFEDKYWIIRFVDPKCFEFQKFEFWLNIVL